MLVPAMTLEEIRREVEKDYPIVHRKSSYVSRKLQRLLRNAIRENTVVRFFDYYSKQKNNWIYKIELNKKLPQITFAVYYYGDKGLTVIEPIASNIMLYCTAHFFNRYNERRNLNLIMPNDIIRSFMNDNVQFTFKRLEEIYPGNYTVFGTTDSGITLGTFNASTNLYKLNTFITRDMLRGDQVEMEVQMKMMLGKYQSKTGLPD